MVDVRISIGATTRLLLTYTEHPIVHSMTTGSRQSEIHLERIIDEPLEGGQSTDHCDSDRETVPKAGESDVSVDSRHGFSG